MIMKSKFLLMLGLFANLQVHASFESIVRTLEKTSSGAKFSGQLFSPEDKEFFLEVLNNNPNFLLQLENSYNRYDLSYPDFFLKNVSYDDGKLTHRVHGDFKLTYFLDGQMYPIDEISVGYQHNIPHETNLYKPTEENYKSEFFQIGFEDGKTVYGFLKDDFNNYRVPSKGKILENTFIYKRRIDSAWDTIDYIYDTNGKRVQTFQEIYIDHEATPLMSGMITDHYLNVATLLYKALNDDNHSMNITVQEGGNLLFQSRGTDHDFGDGLYENWFTQEINIPKEFIRNIFDDPTTTNF